MGQGAEGEDGEVSMGSDTHALARGPGLAKRAHTHAAELRCEGVVTVTPPPRARG